MFIKRIVLEGVDGDVEILRTGDGALVIIDGAETLVPTGSTREARFRVAQNACRTLCGVTRRGEPNATNSMTHEVLAEIERVAGC